jgi:hypothetical protein
MIWPPLYRVRGQSMYKEEGTKKKVLLTEVVSLREEPS